MTERYSSITKISYRRGDATVQKNFYAFKRFFFFKANVMHMKYLECFQKCYHSIHRTAFFW